MASLRELKTFLRIARKPQVSVVRSSGKPVPASPLKISAMIGGHSCRCVYRPDPSLPSSGRGATLCSEKDQPLRSSLLGQLGNAHPHESQASAPPGFFLSAFLPSLACEKTWPHVLLTPPCSFCGGAPRGWHLSTRFIRRPFCWSFRRSGLRALQAPFSLKCFLSEPGPWQPPAHPQGQSAREFLLRSREKGFSRCSLETWGR